VSSADRQLATSFHHEVRCLRFPDKAVANAAFGGPRGMTGGSFHIADHPGLPPISKRPQPGTDPASIGADNKIRTRVRELIAQV
jgi:hypothetical protein